MADNVGNQDSFRLGDRVQHGDVALVQEHLYGIESALTEMIRAARSQRERTERRVLLENLGEKSSIQIHRLATWPDEPVDVIAWCTRNLFELNLILRWVLKSEANMQHWLGQRPQDEIAVLEGVLTLNTSNTASTANSARVLNDRIAELRAISRLHGIKPTTHNTVSFLARAAESRTEYEGMYKFYSKLVHPSSWLVNSDVMSSGGGTYASILVIHAQLYAYDTYARLKAEWNPS